MSHPLPSAILDPSCPADAALVTLRTVAQAPPRLIQPCPSPSSPNPPQMRTSSITERSRAGWPAGRPRSPLVGEDAEAGERGGSQGGDEQRGPDRAARQCEGVEVAYGGQGKQQHESGEGGDEQGDPAPGQRRGQQGEYAQAEDERDQGRGGALFGEGEAGGPREGITGEGRRGDAGPGGGRG